MPQYWAHTESVRHSPTDEKPLTPVSGTTTYDGQSVTLLPDPPQPAASVVTNIANILKRHGLEPAPERKRKTSWKEFLSQHRDVERNEKSRQKYCNQHPD